MMRSININIFRHIYRRNILLQDNIKYIDNKLTLFDRTDNTTYPGNIIHIDTIMRMYDNNEFIILVPESYFDGEDEISRVIVINDKEYIAVQSKYISVIDPNYNNLNTTNIYRDIIDNIVLKIPEESYSPKGKYEKLVINSITIPIFHYFDYNYPSYDEDSNGLLIDPVYNNIRDTDLSNKTLEYVNYLSKININNEPFYTVFENLKCTRLNIFLSMKETIEFKNCNIDVLCISNIMINNVRNGKIIDNDIVENLERHPIVSFENIIGANDVNRIIGFLDFECTDMLLRNSKLISLKNKILIMNDSVNYNINVESIKIDGLSKEIRMNQHTVSIKSHKIDKDIVNMNFTNYGRLIFDIKMYPGSKLYEYEKLEYIKYSIYNSIVSGELLPSNIVSCKKVIMYNCTIDKINHSDIIDGLKFRKCTFKNMNMNKLTLPYNKLSFIECDNINKENIEVINCKSFTFNKFVNSNNKYFDENDEFVYYVLNNVADNCIQKLSLTNVQINMTINADYYKNVKLNNCFVHKLINEINKNIIINNCIISSRN